MERSREPGQHGTGSQHQCFDCSLLSDVSVLGQLTENPPMGPAVRVGLFLQLFLFCSIFKVSYCVAAGDSLLLHRAALDCCS